MGARTPPGDPVFRRPPIRCRDVVFTFQAILAEQVHATAAPFSRWRGKPIGVHKIDTYRIALDLSPVLLPIPRPPVRRYLFILPRHNWRRLETGQTGRRLVAFHAALGCRRSGALPLKGNTWPASASPWNSILTYGKVDAGRPSSCRIWPNWRFLFAGSEATMCAALSGGESASSTAWSAQLRRLERTASAAVYEPYNAQRTWNAVFLVFPIWPSCPPGFAPRIAVTQASWPRSFRQAFRRHRNRSATPPWLSRLPCPGGPVPPATGPGINNTLPAPTRRWNGRASCLPPTFQGTAGRSGRYPERSRWNLHPDQHNNPERLQMPPPHRTT